MGNVWRSSERVPNWPVREAFERSPMAIGEVCIELGWGARGRVDTTRLRRTLGFHPSRNSPRADGVQTRTFTATIPIVNAKAICDVLGEDFDELYDGLMPAQQTAGECETCGEELLHRDPEGICGWCREEIALFGRIRVAS